jgi:phosphatidylinositol glycan class T
LPNTTTEIRIPYTKLTLKYTEHRPDAERGIEIPSGVLTLLDVQGEEGVPPDPESADPLKTGRRHVYTRRLLMDMPTPDFSMPYNVIIMSSTVMAVFFGLMHGALTRRWGWVELAKQN